MIISYYVPIKSPKAKSKTPSHIRKLLLKKKRLYPSRNLSPKDKLTYKRATKAYDEAVSQRYDQIEDSVCNNPSQSKFYGYAYRKLKVNLGIPHLKTESTHIIDDDGEKANLLNATFHKVFQRDNNLKLSLGNAIPSQYHLTEVVATSEKVSEAFHKVPDKFSRSLDGIPAYFWKRSFTPLLSVITHLFNLSLNQGVLPRQWKSAIIIPIHKKGSRNSPNNSRPISLTCVLCRMLEYVIVDNLLHHFFTFNFISDNQFGFFPGRSSCSQLLCAINKWLLCYDFGDNMNIVYTDIAKAFDSVCHSKLISVLSSLGISGKVLKWINFFLCGRVQCVCVNNCFSSLLPVHSGVPQGSILGPLLFLVFIGEAIKVSKLNNSCGGMYLFADDAKFFSNNVKDLQSSLSRITIWLRERQLLLASSKC